MRWVNLNFWTAPSIYSEGPFFLRGGGGGSIDYLLLIIDYLTRMREWRILRVWIRLRFGLRRDEIGFDWVCFFWRGGVIF